MPDVELQLTDAHDLSCFPTSQGYVLRSSHLSLAALAPSPASWVIVAGEAQTLPLPSAPRSGLGMGMGGVGSTMVHLAGDLQRPLACPQPRCLSCPAGILQSSGCHPSPVG